MKTAHILAVFVTAILGLLAGAVPVSAPLAQPAAPRVQFIEFFSPL